MGLYRRGALRFPFLRFPQFCIEKLRFFGFDNCCGFCFYSALGFRFSAKIKSGFRICYSIWRGVLWFALRKNFVATTSTTCTSSLILPAILLLSFARSCSFLYTPNTSQLACVAIGIAWAWLTLDGCVSKEIENNYSSRNSDFSILCDFLLARLKVVAKLRVLVLFFFFAAYCCLNSKST